MITTAVVIVEEHDEVKHGQIMVQTLDDKPVLSDSTGKVHKIVRVVVLTEPTLNALLDVLRDIGVQEFIRNSLPSNVPVLEVKLL